MPDDPIFVALRQGVHLTPEIVVAARTYRLAQIDELWAEVRILEALLDQQSGRHPALAERDLPLEAAQRSRH